MKKCIYFISIVFFLAACSDKKMDDIDTNLNNPTNVSIKMLFPQVTSGVAFNLVGTDLGWFTSLFVEQTAGVGGTMASYDKHIGINSAMTENAWLYAYVSILPNLKVIIDKGSTGDEKGNWKSVAIAKILRTYTMSVITDLFGKVPYSEASLGSKNRTPKFDSQEEIYKDLLKTLDDALVDLSKPSIYKVGGEDFIYGGDTILWRKAAWALKFRLYNHLSKRDVNNVYTQKILDCIQDSSFQSTADEMLFKNFTTTSANPWYQEMNGKNQFAVSKTFYHIVDTLNFPNKENLVEKAIYSNTIVLARNGQADISAIEYSRISKNIVTATASMPLLTFSELKFIEAEAELRLNGNTKRAYNAYKAGIVAVLEKYNNTTNDISQYLYFDINKPFNISKQADLTLLDIIKYKYVSFFPFQAIEAYTDWRRTGFPSLNNTNVPPRRLPYPQSEISSNPQNCKDNSSTLQNGVWFDDGSDD